MAEINLLEVFRTGKIGSVEIGASKEQVKAGLGEPEDWMRHTPVSGGSPYTADESGLWVYGGLEFYWYGNGDCYGDAARLSSISFKPEYLYWSKWETKVDRWIFRRWKGPSMKRLKTALKQEAIPFQDTGLEIVMLRHNGSYEVIPFQQVSTGDDVAEVEAFGTLVLKSGMQVRYGDDNYSIKASLGSDWTFKGSEQFIKWE